RHPRGTRHRFPGGARDVPRPPTLTPAQPPHRAAAIPAPMPAPAPEPAPEPQPAPAPAPSYPDNLDGWIHQALDIMAAHGIPGSYEGIMRNIIRESSGNPQAINLYDSNAAMGIPSKGLLQVIDPTFAAYHVDGTPFDVWDPVANIVAACNYAAHRYGSMDNVNSAY
ncbi:transglycosylase SLT domain-containing protein, partial [Nocardia sp. NPDC003482]